MLTAAVLAAMVVIGFGVSRGDGQPLRALAPWWSLTSGILVLAALTTGLVAYAVPRPAPAASARSTKGAMTGRLTTSLLIVGNMSGLFLSIILDAVALPTHPRGTLLVRCMIWVAFGIGIALTVSARRSASRRAPRLWLLLPPASMVAAAAVRGAFGSSAAMASEVLLVPLFAAAVCSLFVVPAVLISSTVAGFQDTHDRGLSLALLADRRPLVVPVVLAVNLVLVGALLLIAHWTHPDWRLWRNDAPTWVAAGVIAVLLVAVLTLDLRLHLTAADHALLGKVLALLAAVPVAGLAAVAIAPLIWAAGFTRPMVIIALLALVGVAVSLPNLWKRRRGIGYLLVGVVAAGLSMSHRATLSAAPPPFPGWADLGNTFVLAPVGLGVAVLTVVLLSIVVRRKRVLIYLGVVTLWVLVVTATNRWAGGGSVLSIDLVLTVLLGVMTWLWLTQRQAEVDGFEVVLTVAITSVVWLLPLLISLAPDRLGNWLVAAAVLAPGATAVLAEFQGVRRRSPERGELAQWSVCYPLLAALVWAIGGSAAGLLDQMSTVVLSYGLLPLAVLFILAASAGRPRSTPASGGGRSAARRTV